MRISSCSDAAAIMVVPAYERLVSNGSLVLQLHSFEAEHDHGPIGDPDDRPYGNGVLTLV